MSSRMKKAIGGSIHRIREFELEKVNLIDEFDILQIVGEGWFGKILLTEHRSTQTEMVLKALPKAYTGISDFFREFHYGLHLAAHRNIITTYDVAFETAGFYVFSQEYAPLGDLTSNVTETGLGELHAKRVARQLAAAVHHIHSRELVHRDIKLDNILIFRSDFSRIKLCDFGETRRVNTVVRRHNEWLPYSPPEVLQIDTDETYKARTSHDVWQFGIVLFVCLTGCLPWQKAALDDPRYTRYQNWHNATLNIAKKPKLFQLISSRAQRMFKRLLDPKAEKRPVSVLEVNKYLEDRWLAKLGAEKAINGGADERDELCPSMYSFHSSLEEKNQLLHTLTTYGIETTVDRSKKKDRIREWIQSSAIVEETEEDESDLNDDTVFYEDEDEEPASMKGRHFPERRPLAKSENKVKKRTETNTSTARKRLPVKPVERKIPFAPQVAEERETVARFASFPNGDPNLAIVANDVNGNPHSSLKQNSINNKTSVENNHDTNDSVGNSVNSSRDDSIVKNVNNKRENQSINPNGTIRQEDKPDRTTPKSPPIPNRKHRSQTAASGTPTSPRLDNNRPEQTRKTQTQEKPSTPINRLEKLPTNSTSRKPPTTPSGMIRAESAPPAAMPMARLDNRSVTLPVSRTDKTQPRENQPVPLTYPVNGTEGQAANAQMIYNEKPSLPVNQVNPLTMSVASHLVMHSFNALQGMAQSSMPESVVSSPLNPMGNSVVNSMASSVGSSIANSTATSTKQNRKEEQEVPIIYGKDPYEHYGIAQSTVLRGEPVRQGSTGSGSRSVSN